MQFLVVNVLPPESDNDKRLATRPAHLAYVQERKDLVVTSGRLVSDDGADVLGGFYVIECDGRDEVEEFVSNEPYLQAGVWYNDRINVIG